MDYLLRFLLAILEKAMINHIDITAFHIIYNFCCKFRGEERNKKIEIQKLKVF